ncbi:hypothetical protein RHMOL_Rhmol08G0168300 [Rhododendron molle]|uniref:Uncharacterized protein n=1 Tax=Rhododendron molle TaxID=49168 RepID=A0ACC0MQB4_RHOML|nr:hypothetical protein RHMOL_Rhmol08G0168300 [Rhododendron molle]
MRPTSLQMLLYRWWLSFEAEEEKIYPVKEVKLSLHKSLRILILLLRVEKFKRQLIISTVSDVRGLLAISPLFGGAIYDAAQSFNEAYDKVIKKSATSEFSATWAPLSLELLDQLAEPKRCNITLEAYMNTYAGISQCRFNVYSMFAIPLPTLDDQQNLRQPLALPPPTPIKNKKTATASAFTHVAKEIPGKNRKLN